MARAGHSERVAEQNVAPHLALAVDFVNTLEWRGSTMHETLKDPADLVQWLTGANALSAAAGEGLKQWFAAHPRTAAAALRDAIQLREQFHRLLRVKAAGGDFDPADLAKLNRALNAAPARRKLEITHDALGWRVVVRPTASGMLAAVLWSAADLLASPGLTRLRECANASCRWMFIDDSKGGTRRWCSMQSCGNRAKAQRHYQRSKQG